MPNATRPDLQQLIAPVVQLSVEAGNATMEYYQSEYAVERKSDGSPVTAADNAAHEIIEHGLGQLDSVYPVVSEESAQIPEFHERSEWHYFWMVDPIDGTTSFIRGHGDFTVNIALIAGDEPILGVVHNPVRRCTHWGANGIGATKRDEVTGNSSSITVREFSGNDAKILSSTSRKRRPLDNFMNELTRSEITSEVKMIFSSFKFCLMAEGDADVYTGFGRTKEWDTAAGQCILENAGGAVLDLDNRQKLRYNKPDMRNAWFLATGSSNFPWANYVVDELS